MLSFESNADRKNHTGYYLPKVKIKDCKIMTGSNKIYNVKNFTATVIFVVDDIVNLKMWKC